MNDSAPADNAPIDFTALREEMPVVHRWAYFDHAAVAPLSAPAWRRLSQWSLEAMIEGDTAWLGWSRELGQLRQLAARLMGASPDEVALVPNTTAGIGLVAEGFPWRPGDNVVLPADEFPSNQYPWMNLASRGVEVRRVPMPTDRLDLNRLDEACDARTRIVAASWVGYAHGFRSDVAALVELAHRHGALLALDAIQGFGVFPIDVEKLGVDFLAADGHKWMLGPEGAGLFYIRRQHLDLLRPVGVGWGSVAQGNDYNRVELNLKPSAARYEGGSHNMPGFLALHASLQLLHRFGLDSNSDSIARQVLKIGDLAAVRLREIGAEIISVREPAHASGILAFRMPGRDSLEIVKHCESRGVVVRTRAGHVRLSPHAYTNEADVERLIEALRE